MKKKITILVLLALLGLSSFIYAQIPTNGLVAYYPFNGNANDESGNSLNGTVNGATLTTDRFGNNNVAYSFNGSSYIRCTNFPNLTQPYTIACWINLSKYSGQEGEVVLSKYIAGSGSQSEFLIRVNPDSSLVLASVGNIALITKGFKINPNKWYFICGIVNSGNSFIYVDNIQRAKDSLNMTSKTTTPFEIGGYYSVVGLHTQSYFDGVIDNIRICNRVLSVSEISSLYNEGKCSVTVYDTIHKIVTDTTHITVYDTISCVQEKNVALNQTYSASVMDSLNNAGHNPHNAFNGDTTIGSWRSQSYAPQWIAVNFNKPYDISRIKFYYEQSPASQTTQEIYSYDGTNWNFAQTITPYFTNPYKPYDYKLSSPILKSKGIKIKTTQSSSWICWDEIQIFSNVPCFKKVDSIAVTDTLIINAVLTGINPPNNINTIKIYPNPSKEYIYINTGNFASMTGYQIKIINTLSQVVYQTAINQQSLLINLNTFGGFGTYFVQIIDNKSKLIDVRKIILK